MQNKKDIISLAYKLIYESNIAELPTNPKKLSDYLNISLQALNGQNNKSLDLLCEENVNLIFTGTRYILYFKEDAPRLNYIIVHALAQYFLKSNGYNTSFAELLTVILMAPPIILRALRVRRICEISELCRIPPHIVHKYNDVWNNTDGKSNVNILNQYSNCIKSLKKQSEYKPLNRIVSNTIIDIAENHIGDAQNLLSPVEYENLMGDLHYVYLKRGESIYHEFDCGCIKTEVDIELSTLKKEKELQHKPCKFCKAKD